MGMKKSDSRKVGLLGELERRLTLALFVLQVAVEEKNARILDASLHARMHDVLVDHDALEHLGLLHRAAGYLLDARVPLDVDLASAVLLESDGRDGVERDLARQVRPLADELGADAALDDLHHLGLVAHVHRHAHLLLEQLARLLERLSIGADDHGRMHLLLQELLGHGQDLAGEHDDARRAVADLLVLRAADLDHRFGGRMLHLNLAQNGVAVVGHHDAAHRVHQHLVHGLGAETCADHIGNSLSEKNKYLTITELLVACWCGQWVLLTLAA